MTHSQMSTQRGDGSPPAATNSELPTIPGYTLLGALGQGGMGVVYRAHQDSLHRVVALKMLSAGPGASGTLLARFHAEAEAVARLKHPHIVQIYEVGEAGGRPFFSLEYVEGGSLADRLDGTPLVPDEAARLVATLAAAIDFAHQSGIVHRDLKPANVLLAADGTPRITDFGLAKQLQSDSGWTRTGEIMGTPSYMAPEQAGGVTKNIGPACDVYALGAILYELLTGRPPFKGQDAVDTVLLVLSEEPVAPRRLNPKIPRDLETICLKCLEKTPRRRYESAAALAADLRRFLDRAPIVARPVSIVERGTKWARRRPAVAALLLVSVLAIFTLAAGGTFYTWRLGIERTRADLNYRQAQANLHEAQETIDRLLAELGSQALASRPENEPLRRQLLEVALDFCQRLVTQNPEEPLIRLQAARAGRQVADIQALLGEPDAARESYNRAIVELSALAGARRAPRDAPRELAVAIINLGNLAQRMGAVDEARELYAQAVERLVHLRRTDDDPPRIERLLATALSNQGVLLESAGQVGAAGEAYGEALSLLSRLALGAPHDADLALQLAATYNNQAALLLRQGAADDALAACERAIAQIESLSDDAASQPAARYALASASNNLGAAHESSDDLAAAAATYAQAQTVFEELAAAYPQNPLFAQGWADNRHNLARLAVHRQQHFEAERLLADTLPRLEELAARTPQSPAPRQQLAVTLQRLAALLDQRGEELQAEDYATRAIRLDQQLQDDFPGQPEHVSHLATTLETTARMLARRTQLSDAARYLREAVDIQQKAVAAAPTQVAYRWALRGHYEQLAETLSELGELEEAATAAEQVAQVFPHDPRGYCRAAQLLTACIPLVIDAKGTLTPADDTLPLEEQCAQRAVALLREAIERGQSIDELAASTLLEPLRQRDDFRALVGADDEGPSPDGPDE